MFASGLLEKSQVDGAFALVRLSNPSLSLENWRDFARSFLRCDEEGHAKQEGFRVIVTVRDGQGTILGLACCRTTRGLDGQMALRADNLMVMGLTARQEQLVAQQLLNEIANVSALKRCHAIEIQVPLAPALARTLRHLREQGQDSSTFTHQIFTQLLPVASVEPDHHSQGLRP